MAYYFTSESVSEGHPDKVADQISDSILDAFLSQDPQSKVACETFVTTGLCVLGGEVKSTAQNIDFQAIARKTINKIGYTKSEYMFDGNSCGILSAIHAQSDDINRGVVREQEDNQGAGDQGMMFGYAVKESQNLMPYSIEFAHKLLIELAAIRREGKVMTYLRPDSKSQVTLKYDDNNVALGIDTIVISTQHDDFIKAADSSKEAQLKADEQMLEKIFVDVRDILIPRVKATLTDKEKALFDTDFKLLVNPTGKFVIGGPHGDTGLTGRKIIVDTYGGKGAHGGGAFSGKDSSKVDRSAAYATRHIAKNIVASGLANECLVQVAYAIGVAEPVGFYINTYGTCQKQGITDGMIAEKIAKIFDMRPSKIVKRFGLKNPIFQETASYGHFGRQPFSKKVMVQGVEKEVEFFGWEKLDCVDAIKKEFGL